MKGLTIRLLKMTLLYIFQYFHVLANVGSIRIYIRLRVMPLGSLWEYLILSGTNSEMQDFKARWCLWRNSVKL